MKKREKKSLPEVYLHSDLMKCVSNFISCSSFYRNTKLMLRYMFKTTSQTLSFLLYLYLSLSIAVVCQTLWQKLLAQDAWMYRMKINMELYNMKCKQMEGYLVITCYWKIFFYAFHQISTPKNFLSHEHIFSFVSI